MSANLTSSEVDIDYVVNTNGSDCDLSFIAVVTATAEVEETWLVTARDEAHVREIIDEGLLHEHQIISDRILGSERDRELDRCQLIEDHPKPSNQPPHTPSHEALTALIRSAQSIGTEESAAATATLIADYFSTGSV